MPETCVLIEYTFSSFDLMTQKSELLSFYFYYFFYYCRSSYSRTHWEVGFNLTTPTAAWPHYTDQSAAPCYDAPCNYTDQLQSCRFQERYTCNNWCSILHSTNAWQVSAITEMQSTFTCCQSVAQVDKSLHINTATLMLCECWTLGCSDGLTMLFSCKAIL